MPKQTNLQANEIAVLRALKDGKALTVEELQDITALEHVAVARAAYSLQQAGFARISETAKIVTHLTAEGENVLEKDLPEILLLKEIGNRTTPLAKIKLQQKEIALGWAKTKGWVEIKKDGVRVTGAGAEALKKEQKEISILKNAGNASKADLDILKRRQFLDYEQKVVRSTQLTKEGLQAARTAKETEEISQITPDLIKSGKWKSAKLRRYNITASAPQIWPGKKQPYRAFLDNVKTKLITLGFKEMTGPLIELEFWNFDALFQPQNHPARDWASTYAMKYPKEGKLPNKTIVARVKAAHENGWITGSTGWGYKWDAKQASKLMPRAHGTALSARQLVSRVEIPGKYFAIGRCYRPDVFDAKHLIEFNQVEGIVIDKSLTFRNLLGILKMFAIEIAGVKEIKFAPSYFPFTEPSVELYAKHPKLGWMELGGAGIFREELTRPLGIKEPVIAWGLGIDRLAMLKLGISDIRDLFSYNLGLLREEKLM